MKLNLPPSALLGPSAAEGIQSLLSGIGHPLDTDWTPDKAVSKAHGAKVRADKEHGSAVCKGVVEAVRLLTGVAGVTEYRFDERRLWRFDAAWPSYFVALELNGWNSHHRRRRMEEDNVKLASAIRLGWRVFYATVKQAREQAPLWIATAIEYGPVERKYAAHAPSIDRLRELADSSHVQEWMKADDDF